MVFVAGLARRESDGTPSGDLHDVSIDDGSRTGFDRERDGQTARGHGHIDDERCGAESFAPDRRKSRNGLLDFRSLRKAERVGDDRAVFGEADELRAGPGQHFDVRAEFAPRPIKAILRGAEDTGAVRRGEHGAGPNDIASFAIIEG